jgi:hypothetical protein
MSNGQAARFEDLNELLAERVPELREGIEAEYRSWEGEAPGQHVIYGDFLAQYLLKLLETGADGQRLRELFAFLEELATNPDDHVQEVVAVTVLEDLAEDMAILAKARQFMGPATLALLA